MVMTIVKEWEITVSITRTLRYPIEDNEGAEEIWTWANSFEGKRLILTDFLKRLNCSGVPSFPGTRNADMFIDEIELKETEVRSTDTDPRV